MYVTITILGQSVTTLFPISVLTDIRPCVVCHTQTLIRWPKKRRPGTRKLWLHMNKLEQASPPCFVLSSPLSTANNVHLVRCCRTTPLSLHFCFSLLLHTFNPSPVLSSISFVFLDAYAALQEQVRALELKYTQEETASTFVLFCACVTLSLSPSSSCACVCVCVGYSLYLYFGIEALLEIPDFFLFFGVGAWVWMGDGVCLPLVYILAGVALFSFRSIT